MNNLFDNSTLPLLEQVVSFTQARHGVLAGNIANIDTPGYRTRDLSVDEFRTQLKQKIEERRAAAAQAYGTPAGVSPGILAAGTGSDARHTAKAEDPYKGILRHDDNNTSMEHQVTEIAKNHSHHNLALSLMNAQFRLIRAAVTERA